MFIYILNFLHDRLKSTNDIQQCLNCEIIHDTRCISELAGINKGCDFENINDKIINIFKILNKYNVTNQDTNEIFNKLVINNNNSWILERFDNLDMESQEVLSGIANNEVDTVQKQKSFLIKTKLKQLKMTGRRLLFETGNIYEPTIQRCF